MSRFKIFILLTLYSVQIFSQEDLSVDDAIKIALEKNFQVQISRQQQQIAGLQNNLGAAGMSPTVSLNGSATTANLNSSQVFNTGAVQERQGAQSSGISGSLNADWIIFDGLKMFAVKKRLAIGEELSALELRQQMETVIYDVIAAYYDVVRVTQLIKAANQNLAVYQERRKVAELRQQIGSDSKVEVLLSKSDENKAKSAIIQLELQLLKAKTELNTLMNRPVDMDFKTADTITVNYQPSLDELKKSSRSSNAGILIAKKNEEILAQGVAEARSANLPFITLSGAYIYTRTKSQAGLLFSNRQNGLNFGVTGRWVIFNGGKNNRLVKERQIIALNQKFFTGQSELQVDAMVYVNYQSFLLNQKILSMEFQNLQDSKDVQFISMERYKIGKANLLETIETQQNLEDAQVRYINALYNIKLAEADLLRINGSLIK